MDRKRWVTKGILLLLLIHCLSCNGGKGFHFKRWSIQEMVQYWGPPHAAKWDSPGNGSCGWWLSGDWGKTGESFRAWNSTSGQSKSNSLTATFQDGKVIRWRIDPGADAFDWTK